MYIQEPPLSPGMLICKFIFFRGLQGLASCHLEPQSSGDGSSDPRTPDKRGGTVVGLG